MSATRYSVASFEYAAQSHGFTDLIEIEDASGRVVAHVSPNLRVWEGAANGWQPGTREIVA